MQKELNLTETDFIIPKIPSSFVAREMKSSKDKGSGEAKLYVGPMVRQQDIDEFFQFGTQYQYVLLKSNLLDYLKKVEIEYVYHKFNEYQEANLSAWMQRYNEIDSLEQNENPIQMEAFCDTKNRYYIRSQRGDLFYQQIRRLIVPRITNLHFHKDSTQQKIYILLELNTNLDSDADKKNEDAAEKLLLPYNRILFGAPGTGKSYKLKQEQEEYFDDSHYERVTFHPAYSYAQFFGSYKPVSVGKDISYEFVCGPFLRILLRALQNPSENYLLIIEEINRADVAAVFGDVFQLLDRKDGRSEYEIDIPEDLRRFLSEKPREGEPDFSNLLKDGGALSSGKLYLPENFYIWATMNSADQGVLPLDTAFKRRWTFEYLDIDNNAEKAQYHTPAAEGEKPAFVWQEIRNIINARLAATEDIAEDRWLGSFFLKEHDFDSVEAFKKVFKSKVLMYLYQDVAKYARPGEIFAERYASYSKLCKAFDEKGMGIFAGQDKDDAE